MRKSRKLSILLVLLLAFITSMTIVTACGPSSGNNGTTSTVTSSIESSENSEGLDHSSSDLGSSEEDSSVEVHTCEFTEVVSEQALKSQATCTQPAEYYLSCSCGELSEQTFTHGDPLGHKLTHHDRKEATESEEGNVEYWSCSICGEYFSDSNGESLIEDKQSVVIPATGHVCVFDKKVEAEKYVKTAATCSRYAEYYFSCACGEHGEETFMGSTYAIHAITVYKDTLEATCLEDGFKAHWKCHDCGKYFLDEFCENEVSYDSLILKATGHNATEKAIDKYIKDEATCSSYAVYFKSCAVCGEKLEETFTVEGYASHKDVEYVEEIAANCKDGGVQAHWECHDCGKYFLDEACEQEVEYNAIIIPAKGHEAVENAIDKYIKDEATCSSLAIYYKSCAVCGEALSETFEGGEYAPHSNVKLVEEVQATCVNTGFAKHWECVDCGKYFLDELCEKEVSREELLIQAKGHTYGENVHENYLMEDATCSSLAKYHTSCNDCGAVSEDGTFTAGEYAPHANVKYYEAVEATCLASGLKEHWKCEDCGKYFADETCEKAVAYSALIVTTSHNYIEVVDEKLIKSEATCLVATTYYKSCEYCGEATNETFTYGETAEHSFSESEVIDATCQEGGYTIEKCGVCYTERKVNETQKLEHLGVYNVTVEATHNQAGEGVYSCEHCDQTKVVVLEKIAHEYVSVKTEPTCENGGYTTYSCECGDSYETDLIPALGHAFNKIVEEKQATCTESGYLTVECENCGATQTTNYQALGHDEVQATCETDGYCRVCGEVLSQKLGHAWNFVYDQKPACEEDGFVVYNCGICGNEKTEIPNEYLKTGHNEQAIEWKEKNLPVDGKLCVYKTVESGECPDCGEIIVHEGEETLIHNYVYTITKEATCLEEGEKTYVCSVCGDVKDEIEYYSAPEAHKWNAVGDTCELCGKTKTVAGGTTTNVSGDQLSNEIEFDDASVSIDSATQEQLKQELGSDEKVELKVETVNKEEVDGMANSLTDEEKALLEGKTVYNFEMSSGDKNITKFEGKITIKIPYELGDEDPDDIVVWYLAVVCDEEGNPILDEDGLYQHELTLVEAQYIEIDGVGYAVFETDHFSYYTVTRLTAKQRCEKFGHKLLVTQVIATCSSNGYTLHSCLRCGNKEVTDEVEALGHDFVLNEQTYAEATCESAGYERHECSRCKLGYEVKHEALGHAWASVERIEATCQSVGSERFVCENCSSERETTIPMLDHNYEVTIVKATCESAGYTYKKCVDCGNEVITDRTEALGHDGYEVDHEPTCLEEGYTEHWCRTCEKMFKKDNHRGKTDHKWNVENPDCEHDKVCKHCNKRDEKAPNNGNAYGHDYKDGKCKHCEKECKHNNLKYSHETPATCDQEGYKVYICKKCLAFVNGEVIEKTDHEYEVKQRVEATCLKPAHTVEKCKTCNSERIVESGEKAEHNYVAGVCSYCGHSASEGSSFYLTLIESISGIDNICITVKDFKLEGRSNRGDGEFVTEDAIYTVNVNELMLYLDENGKLAGAGHVSLLLVGLEDVDVTIDAKLIIENGYIYVTLDSNFEEYSYAVRAGVETMLASLMEDAFGLRIKGMGSVLELLENDVLPVAKLFVAANESELEQILSNIFNLFFTCEEIDGNLVHYFDFEKVREINDDLVELTIDKFVDKYFGENSYYNVYSTVLDILDLTVSEIPAYVEGLGIGYEDLVEVVNTVCHELLGAPDDFDIDDVFTSEEYGSYVIGELIFEDEGYTGIINQISDMLTSNSLYFLVSEGDERNAWYIHDQIASIIDTAGEYVAISFTTDKDGNIKGFDVELNDLMVEAGSHYQTVLTIDVSLVIGEKINVDWQHMIDRVNKQVELLPEFEDEISYEQGYWSRSNGVMEYNGELYEYESMTYRIYKRARRYSQIKEGMIAILPHCGDWISYEVVYPYESAEFYYQTRILMTEGGYIYLLVDYYNDIFVELTIDENGNGFTYVNPNGESGSFVVEDDYPTVEQIEACFGTINWINESSYLNGDSIYYNVVTGELSDRSQHRYYIAERVEPTDCATDGYELYRCEHCGEEYYRYFNHFSHRYELDKDASLIPTECENEGYRAYKCVNCGETYREYFYMSHSYVEKCRIPEGFENCEQAIEIYEECVNCGDCIGSHILYGHGHYFERQYIYQNGNIVISNSCKACGSIEASEVYCAIETDQIEFELVEGREYNRAVLKITPEVSGYYELFSYGDYYNDPYAELYDEFGMHIDYDHDGAMNWNFGIYTYLEAGFSYYLYLGGCEGATVCLKPHSDEHDVTINLSDYGCECGGVVRIVLTFEEYRVEISHNSYGGKTKYAADGYCEECEGVNYADYDYSAEYPVASDYPDYSYDSSYPEVDYPSEPDKEYGECPIMVDYNINSYENESCRVISAVWLYIYNGYTGEVCFEGEVARFETNTYRHSTATIWSNESGEFTDENGKVIYFEKQIRDRVCHRCGMPVSRQESVYYYDENGFEFKTSELDYVYNEAGEKYLILERSTEYQLVNVNGSEHTRKAKQYTYEYDSEGNLTYWVVTTYTYDGCKLITTTEDINGKVSSKESFDHMTSEKVVEEESFVNETTDENGNYVRIEATVYETYCRVCGASLSRRGNTYHYDERGNTVKEIYTSYRAYAYDAENYGFVKDTETEYSYVMVEYEPGKFIRRTAQEKYVYYGENNEVKSWDSRTWHYSGCEYEVIFENSDGSSWVDYRGSNHNMHTEYRLVAGATSCLEGVESWSVCSYCDYEYYNYYNGQSHIINRCSCNTVIYNLSDYGSECGGYVYVYSCACGERFEFERNTNCDFDFKHEWLYENEKVRDHELQTYSCAVTDTYEGRNPCGFVYTCETWIEVGENCVGVRHYVYTFNAKSETPLVLSYSYLTGNYYHSTVSVESDGEYYVEDGLEVYVTGSLNVCKKCGVTTYKYTTVSYVDPVTGMVIKSSSKYEHYNNLGMLSYTEYYEYARIYDEILNASSLKQVYNLYVYYDNNGRAYNIYDYRYTYGYVYNEEMTDSRSVQLSRVYKEYNSIEDLENGNASYWNNEEYNYEACICQPTTIYTNSRGEYWVEKQSYHSGYGWYTYWIQEPTCTQQGIRAEACTWCDYETTYTRSAYGHNYRYNGELYVCSRCNLQNFTGNDGSLVLEDLTARYGEGTHYVIGVNAYDANGYEVIISLIVNNGTDMEEEFMLNDYIAIDRKDGKVYIAVEDVINAVSLIAEIMEADYTICNQMVRINFVPEDGDLSFDYAITLDPHVLTYQVSASDSVDKSSHSASCRICGELVIENDGCVWVRTYSDEVTENGIITYVYTYKCRYCDNTYTQRNWSTLTDASNCTYTEHVQVEYNGNVVSEYDSEYTHHEYEYAFTGTVNGETLELKHSYKCANCDELGSERSCGSWGGYSYTYVENGVTKTAIYYYCYDCKFSYKIVSYSVLVDASECRYCVYYECYANWNESTQSYDSLNLSYYYEVNHTESEYVYCESEDGSFSNKHLVNCKVCGEQLYQQYCSFVNDYSEAVIIDGITHNINKWHCEICGFIYEEDKYIVYSEETKCEYTEYVVLNWNWDEQSQSYLNTYTTEQEYSTHGVISARDIYENWDEAKVDSVIVFDLMSDSSGFAKFGIGQGYSSYKDDTYGWAGLLYAYGAIYSKDYAAPLQGKNWAEIEASEELFEIWNTIIRWWKIDPNEELDFFVAMGECDCQK